METVDAIVKATVQVLRRNGKAGLTTTRIAARAGVSVGTLYQYFPHKVALLQEALRRHLELLSTAMEAACDAAEGKPVATVAETLADAWIQTKLGSVDASIALYAVAEDLEVRTITAGFRTRCTAAMVRALVGASDGGMAQPEVVAATLLGALSGASREMLDPLATTAVREQRCVQLRTLVRAYLLAAQAETRAGFDYRETPSSGELAVA